MSLSRRVNSSLRSQHIHSPIRDKFDDGDVDAYAPTIVEDLLQGASEWRNIEDIIRLTLKALTEVVKAQGESLRELERQMPTRASKAEVSSGLSLKANTTDVSSTISEVIVSLEGKVSQSDLNTTLRDYVLNSELQYLLSNKANVDDIKSLVESRAGGHDVRKEVSTVNDRLDDLYRDFNKKLANYVSQREYQSLVTTVDQKANLQDITEELNTKANKQSVSNALHKKANRAEIEALLARKAETVDLQRVLDELDTKFDGGVIDRINHLLDNKVDKSDFGLLTANLSNKAEKADIELLSASLSNHKVSIEDTIQDLRRATENFKVDLEDIEKFLNDNLNSKADSSEVDRLIQIISKKTDSDHLNGSFMKIKNDVNEDVRSLRDELHQFKRQIGEEVGERHGRSKGLHDKLSDEVHRLSDQLKTILQERRNDLEETTNVVKTISNNTRKEIQLTTDQLTEDIISIKRELDEHLHKKLDKKEWTQTKTKLTSQIETKPDLSEIQNIIDKFQDQLDARFRENAEAFKGLLDDHENDVHNALSKKANLNDLNSALLGKADMSIFNSILNQKTDTQDFDNLRKKVEKVSQNMESVVLIKEFDALADKYSQRIEMIQKELTNKANIPDVCALLDAKTNIDDVNHALTDIHKELDVKADSEALEKLNKDQSAINESLCTENIVARWAWKSGELKSGSMVPWEIQLSNTLPDNFLWEKDKTNVLTVAPGLYEVTFGFYARKKPTVQFLVNGEPILSASNQASTVVHHVTRKDVSINKHSSGNITGLTVVDFIVLPARARISIAYSGEYLGEGFLGLKRL